ncbi:hypothetical protein FS749_009733 [Ceratobasidium sp. UAMH 11750]|nr:hypothetical protein FS749_009733 [Ceratobasidium sp. UAMH 11750]
MASWQSQREVRELSYDSLLTQGSTPSQAPACPLSAPSSRQPEIAMSSQSRVRQASSPKLVNWSRGSSMSGRHVQRGQGSVVGLRAVREL